MTRFSRADIIEIGRLNSGTSAEFIGFNTKTRKKGIYKINGCVLGIDNDDIREKLASDILHSLNVDSANIDLVYDQDTDQNSYFSNYIIEDNEELIAPNINGCEGTFQNPIDNLCERYMQGINKLTNDEKLISDSRKNFYHYTYMCCILDCYDIKPDNLPLIHNKATNNYSIAPWFDFGTAFCPEHKSASIYEMSTDDILETLLKNHYEDIKDIVTKVNTSLTTEKIDEIFSSDYIVEGLDISEISKIKSRLISQIEKSKQLEASRNSVTKMNFGGIKEFFTNIKNRFATMFGKTKQLPNNTEIIKIANTPNTSPNITDNLSTLVNDTIEDINYPPTDIQPPVK